MFPKPSEIVVRGRNFQQQTAACGEHALEMGFFGLLPPEDQPFDRLFMLKGIQWSASGTPGSLVQADLFITDGNPTNRHYLARLVAPTAPSGQFEGIQDFPLPIRAFRGQFRHLCCEQVAGTLGTGSFWIFGYFADDE